MVFEDIEQELEVYERGRQLRLVYNTPAWETIIGALEDYRDKAKQELVDLPPGHPSVVTAHAAASALDDTVAKFKMDIANAVQTAATPSAELISYLSGAIQSMDVARAIGQDV